MLRRGMNMLRRKRSPYEALERALGYAFRNSDLLAMALTHRSYRFEHPEINYDNQRLEFLGDAVLGSVTASHLYNTFKDEDEGMLTPLRSQLTSGRAFAEIARRIELGSFLKMGKGEELSGGRARESTLADAFEAVVGAAYLDRGTDAVQKIFERLCLAEIQPTKAGVWKENPKGELQIVAHRRLNAAPRYRTVRESGPAHAKTFAVEICVRDRVIGRGTGSSKQRAQVEAAADALARLKRESTGSWDIP